jgi:hypothetical protein
VHYEGKVIQAIDEIHPQTGRSVINNQTLEEIEARYPGAFVMEWEKYIDLHDEAVKSPPIEISEEKFIEMLEVLPPVNWHREEETESFKMSERLSGSITAILCRVGDRYFQMSDSFFMKHAEIVSKVMSAFPDVLAKKEGA